MPGVCLILEAPGGPPQYAIEYPDLLQVPCIPPQLAHDLDQEALLHAGFDPCELGVRAREDKVVAVDDASQAAGGVVEAARAGRPLGEAVLLELGRQECLPTRRGIPGAIQAPLEAAAEPRSPDLGRQLDKDVPHRGRMQMSLAGIYDEYLAPAPPVGPA